MDAGFETDRNNMRRDLAELIAIPSFSRDREQCRNALSWLLRRAGEMGMRTGVTEEGDAGFAEIGQGRVTMGVLVHVDVVDPGDMEKWLSPPLTLTTREGKWFGRGVLDDKGPVVMALYALKGALDGGQPIRKRIRLVAGTSEETDWTDMAHYRRAFGSPDYGFSPDAGFPVYNIEKGYADVTLLFPREDVSFLSAGDSPNTVPSRAEIACGGQRRIYSGISVHSSLPQRGVNAILALAEAEPEHGFSRFLNRFFKDGGFHGEALGLDRLGDRQGETFVGRTACAPTVLKLEGESIRLNINIRFRAGLTAEDLERAFSAYEQEYAYVFSLYVDAQPMLVCPQQPFIREMNALAQRHGFPSGCTAADGSTYSGTMVNHVGWGPMPVSDNCAHQENEHMDVEYFFRAARLYREYLTLSAAKAE